MRDKTLTTDAPAKGLRAIIAAFLVIALCVGPLTAIVAADSSYRVQPGDSLISIAARYGVTVDAIVAANNLPNRSTIYAGQTLTIPSPGSQQRPQPPQGQSTGSTYVVQPGDTLSDIAVRYGTTTDVLQRANGLASTTIYAGQVLKIVGPSAPAAPTQAPPTATTAPAAPASTIAPAQAQQKPATYVVQVGDNLITLAARFGVSREALAAANGISPTDFLYINQVLKIPGGQTTPNSQPTAAPVIPIPPAATSVPNAGATTTPQPANSAANAQAGKPTQYTVKPGDTLASLAIQFNTTVQAIMQLNNMSDANFLRTGQVLTLVKGNDQNNDTPAVTPVAEPAPPMGALGPKWVDVNISQQVMIAYEGDTPVFTSKVSTGVDNHPTVEGTFRIYAKYVSTTMKGGEGAEYYYLPDVPYTMYFYSGYALHGAYWHNNFGHPMSHGCVNLPDDVSKWMFDWAPIGTMVVTHQ